MKLRNNDQIYSFFYFGKDEGFKKFYNPLRAIVHYQNYQLDLRSNQKIERDLSSLLNRLDDIKYRGNENCTIFHLSYELGLLLNKVDLAPLPEILAIELVYKSEEEVDFEFVQNNVSLKRIESIEYSKYEKSFNEGYEHLLDGDCYQFNLTFPLKYKFEVDAVELIGRLFSNKNYVGAYAHATYLGPLNQLLLSNSPECLFQLGERQDKLYLWSMPIKGTVKLKSGSSFKEAWTNLTNSKKERAELDMITDLVRNDINRIDEPSAEVITRSSPLRVPGILHQFSLISKEIPKQTTLRTLLRALFPGGSITGAPKKRVMEILKSIENGPRGFYCGSTFFSHKNKFAASINIRTAEIDLTKSELSYHAGGGITLNSKSLDEYQELMLKVDSFCRMLGPVRK